MHLMMKLTITLLQFLHFHQWARRHLMTNA
jgi:hypothetical protein